MLAMLSRSIRVDRARGVTVTQQTLLAVSLEGYSYNQMIAFKEKVEYILNGMPPDSWPADSTLFSWFYGKIKASRGMQRIIDKIKDSSPTSNMRTFAWLWEQFSDYLAELREDQNEREFREAMMKETKTDTRPAKEKVKATAAAAAKAAAAAAVPPKKKTSPQPPPPPPKREGKGDGGKGKGKGKDKGKGADCPFSHEAAPANTAKKGSGRSLASVEALKAQGIFLDERSMGEIVDSGFEMIPDLWMHSVNYAATVLNAFQAIGVDAIQLSQDTIDLLNKQHVEQLHGQIAQLKGAAYQALGITTVATVRTA
ncbi:hypothetical protein AK812_SmicGene39659 [Symbiodinium microadriaticum]|uniref:Uncharacterized protein n=1 Tax=Symbiodinium microadriaticum TaxID=2951 RepID=A0A1Q9CAN8_SYMMI|nr:hypothetical protein AK812_SmicGene39659 [Symbiodinium microadriaticum]